MRRALVIVGLLLALAVAAAAALLMFVDVNQFRGRIQSDLQKQLGRPVELGTMTLKLLPLSIQVENVSIGESPEFPTGRAFATAKEVRVSVQLLPLLRKEVEIHSILLREPEIEMVRNKAGKWNFDGLGGDSKHQSSGAGVSIGDLEIVEGKIAKSELEKPASRTVYDHVDVSLKDFTPGKGLALKATVHLPNSAKDALLIEAKGGQPGTALTGRLTLKDASLAGLEQFLMTDAKRGMEGELSGTSDFESLAGVSSAKGGFDFKNVKVRGASLGHPVHIEYAASENASSGVVKIPVLKMEVGKVPILASGELNTKASTVDTNLRINEASLTELLALAKIFGAEGVGGSGILTVNVHVQGPMDKPRYSGTGSIREASINTPALTKPLQIRSANLKFQETSAGLENMVAALGTSNIKGDLSATSFTGPSLDFHLDIDKIDVAEMQQLTASPKAGASSSSGNSMSAKGSLQVGKVIREDLTLEQVRAECTFSRGVLTLNPLTASVFGGKQVGSITVDTRSQPATFAMNTKLENVDANQLLSATTSVKKTLYGLMAAGGDANLKLLPGDQIARTLNGNLNLKLTKGRLAGMNILNEVANIGKFLGFAHSNDAFTNIVQLAGDVRIRDGVASTENLLLQMTGGTLASTGTVNLVDQTLNLRITTVLDKDASQKAGGTQIGGFLTTALANSKGELVIPALVTGTFAHPKFLPDAARMGEMRLKNLLPTSGNPGALTTGIVGAITGQKGAGRALLDSLSGKPQPGANAPANGNQPPAAGGLFDVLDSLRKKKDPKP